MPMVSVLLADNFSLLLGIVVFLATIRLSLHGLLSSHWRGLSPSEIVTSHSCQQRGHRLSSSRAASFTRSFRELPSLSLQRFSSRDIVSLLVTSTGAILVPSLSDFPDECICLLDELALARSTKWIPLRRAYVLTPIRRASGPSFLKAIPRAAFRDEHLSSILIIMYLIKRYV